MQEAKIGSSAGHWIREFTPCHFRSCESRNLVCTWQRTRLLLKYLFAFGSLHVLPVSFQMRLVWDHLHTSLHLMSLKTFLTFFLIRSTWIPSPRCILSGQNVIKVSSIYHNRASARALSMCLMEWKETTICVYFFKWGWTHFKSNLDLQGSSFKKKKKKNHN